MCESFKCLVSQPDSYNFRVKELKPDTPVTPTPRPLTVPTTLAEIDRLQPGNNRTSGLPRLEIQVIQVC